ncbi:RHS repeat domain-containing protein [Inhella sp.]|uniref:RHS repeat domain-containing protein n=1 Tax=Inhella sp. TaxID=1921806 RepID=UPI0035B4D55C
MRQTLHLGVHVAIAALLLGATHPAGAQIPVSPTPTSRFLYDAEGNITHRIQAPSSLALSNQLRYDRLQRLYQHLDPSLGTTDLGYLGGSEHLSQVVDPRRLTTAYTPDGLGQVRRTVNPDRGTVVVNYNAAGLPTKITWPSFSHVNLGYDALNRLTMESFTKMDSKSQLGEGYQLGYQYDQTGVGFSHGVGRLTTTTFPVGHTRFRYDPLGRLVGTDLVINAANRSRTFTTQYAYNPAGQLTQVVYPSGRVLSLGLSDGLPESLAVSFAPDQPSTPLLSNIRWTAWSRLPGSGDTPSWLSWDWQLAGGGQLPHTRQFDEWGRLIAHPLGPYQRAIGYDAADRIDRLIHTLAVDGSPQPSLDQVFGYDANSRLTATTRGVQQWRYAYDASGNRTEHQSPAFAGLGVYATASSSNRLMTVSQPAMAWSYDTQGNGLGPNAGNPLGAGLEFLYNAAGQISRTTRGPAVTYYHYDTGRRRVLKDSSSNPGGGWTVFVHGLHGELLGEYDQQTGSAIREYVWLGRTPVAVLGRTATAGADEAFFLHADHLDTSRLATDRLGRVRWSWMAEPFGNEAANPQPTAGLDALNVPLRMPGQYWDAESGLFYNHHRYYEPRVGRYVQSDPIGLAGGINTYSYVEGNPVSKVDPEGLQTYVCKRPLGGKPGSFAPPVLNHTYVCVGTGKDMVCGSTTASSGSVLSNIAPGSSGAPTTPDKDYFLPDACEKEWDQDRCIESCIENELKKPTRPRYAVGPLGTDCQEYTAEVIRICKKRCVRG